MAADLSSLSGYTTSFSPSRGNSSSSNRVPAPPPKSEIHDPSSSESRSASMTGPPLPPPPPTHASSSSYQPNTQPPPSRQSQDPPIPQPPQPGESWLPPVLLDKTTQQLTPLLSSPSHLRALAQTHPSLHPSISPLPPLLSQTSHLANHISHTHARLHALRNRTQRHLLHLHALERQWREKQAQLDGELEPWSAKRLYGRLREAEAEAERVGEGMEQSWLEGDGVVEEREVSEVLKGFREGRGRLWRRREMRERWDEGRVGGWR